MGNVWLRFVKNHARYCHVITHELLLLRVTPHFPSSRISRATQTRWEKQFHFQQGNISSLIKFGLKFSWFSVIWTIKVNMLWNKSRSRELISINLYNLIWGIFNQHSMAWTYSLVRYYLKCWKKKFGTPLQKAVSIFVMFHVRPLTRLTNKSPRTLYTSVVKSTSTCYYFNMFRPILHGHPQAVFRLFIGKAHIHTYEYNWHASPSCAQWLRLNCLNSLKFCEI
jgi:hypothetical protein